MKTVIKIFLIVIAMIVISGTIFGIIDYNRAKNGKEPIFIYRNYIFHNKGQVTVTEYYGLGYKIVMFSSNEKPKFLLFGLGTYAWFIGSNDIIDIEIIIAEKCDNKAELYYIVDDRNIYTYCLNSIKIISENNSLELKEYLMINTNAINDIIIKFTDNNTNSYDDGGTILYKGEEFNLLKCHTLDGNNDIYVGNKNMGYSNSFCGYDNF
jgi:hypothetical protein